MLNFTNGGKQRLSAEIDGLVDKKTIIRPLVYKLAAAASVAGLIYFSFQYFENKDVSTPLKLAELQNIAPRSSDAIVTLSTGEVINPDTIVVGKTVLFGSAIIQKDESGQLIYKYSNEKKSDNIVSTLQTSKSEQYTIELSDGTKVTLNKQSKLAFPSQFGDSDRVVELSGEAYFEVTKTLSHSKFIVKTSSQTIQVLGTKFNVSAYANVSTVKTTLAEGSVNITPTNKALGPIKLKPNQQAILNDSAITRVNIDAEKIIDWLH